VLYRQEQLSQYERSPRSYTKRKTPYWQESIKEKRAKQILQVLAEKKDNHIEVPSLSTANNCND